MDHEYMWHKFPEEMPKNEGKYLVCDFNGKLTIKNFYFVTDDSPFFKKTNYFSRGGRNRRSVCENVSYWCELPTPPEVDERMAEINRLNQKIAELNIQILKLKGENVGRAQDVHKESN